MEYDTNTIMLTHYTVGFTELTSQCVSLYFLLFGFTVLISLCISAFTDFNLLLTLRSAQLTLNLYTAS